MWSPVHVEHVCSKLVSFPMTSSIPPTRLLVELINWIFLNHFISISCRASKWRHVLHAGQHGYRHASSATRQGDVCWTSEQTNSLPTIDEVSDCRILTNEDSLQRYLRRASFIRLCDYLIVNTFHVLAVNSVQSLKNHFLEQLEATPSKDEILDYVEEIKRKVEKAIQAESPEGQAAAAAEAAAAVAAAESKSGHGTPTAYADNSTTGWSAYLLLNFIHHESLSLQEDDAAKRHIPLFLTEMKLLMEAIQYHPDATTFQNRTLKSNGLWNCTLSFVPLLFRRYSPCDHQLSEHAAVHR